MKHSNIFKFGVAGLAIAALAGTFANTAQAATEPFTATANVAILATLDVTEDVQLNFGRVILGSAGSFVVVVTPGGALTPAPTGGTGFSHDGGQLAGDFSVTGTTGATFDVTLSSPSCGDAGLALSALTNNVSDNNLTTGGAFETGGTLTVASTTTVGNLTCTYTVDVNILTAP